MSEKINVFILAAGFGTRLRPISYHLPKPLFPILGKPILQYVLEKVSHPPFDKIGVNVHFKRQMIEDWILSSKYAERIKLFQEETILGTGGALENAESFLKNGHFLVHNADILSNIDLNALIKFHLSSGNIATLTVHDCEKFNQLCIDRNGYLKGLKTATKEMEYDKMLAFTGIAAYSPQFLRFLTKGYSSVVTAWLKAIKEGYPIKTMDVSGSKWSDIGTLEAYTESVSEKLEENGERIFIHPSVRIEGNIEVIGKVSVEKDCVLKENVQLKNCILFPETKLPPHTKVFDCIKGDLFQIPLKIIADKTYYLKHFKAHKTIIKLLAKIFNHVSYKTKLLLIGSGGSDRQYFRITNQEKTVVLMICSQKDSDFNRHIQLTEYFEVSDIPVPSIKAVDYEGKMAIFDDLGDLTLYDKMKFTHDDNEIEKIYRAVINILVQIHSVTQESRLKFPNFNERIFDYEHAKWESSYFFERFVKGFCSMPNNMDDQLEKEFHELAIMMTGFRKTMIHRDFQSQNIMVNSNNISGIVDFQGARLGPPAYDIASLLWDPYVRLKETLKENLIDYYLIRMKEINGHGFDKNEFIESLMPSRLQRHMQALGAYSFLSIIKGKKYFLKYIPRAFSLLREEVELCQNTYPALLKMLMNLDLRLKKISTD